MTQLVRKHAQKVASTCVCVQLKRGPVKLRQLFHFIVHVVQIIAPDSMREILKRTKLIYLQTWSSPLIQWLSDRNMQIGARASALIHHEVISSEA